MSIQETFPEALLDQYLTGTISEADRKVLMDWFNSFSDESVSVESGDGRSKAAVRESIWKAIEKRTQVYGQQTAAGQPPILQMQPEKSDEAQRPQPQLLPSPKKALSIRMTAVAAACLLLVALGWWGRVYFGSSNNKQAAQLTGVGDRQMQASDPVVVNHNGAILTLGNGKQVALDSTGAKEIATQAGVRVLQQGGQIRYLIADGSLGNGVGKGTRRGVGNNQRQRAAAAGDLTENMPLAGTVYNTMTTPRGKQFSLILPDGTKVWLNAASSITYPVTFAKDRRTVTVTGEVYFEVAHLTLADHKTRIPFDVQSGQLQVEVLGTHFAIKNYPEERQIKTTLLEGSVSVHYGKDGTRKTMVPGQQATLDRTGSNNIALQAVDTRQAIAWKDGLFSFKDEPLSDILRQVARWYDVETGADPSKMKLRFSGVISKRAKLRDLLDVLSATGVVQFKISGHKVHGY